MVCDSCRISLTSFFHSLSKTRRKRPIPDNWATSDGISAYKPTEASEPLYPGGRVLAVNPTGELALVGSADGVAGVYSISQKNVLQTLKADGPVTGGTWAGDKAVVASATGSVKVFENGSEVASFASHAGEVTAIDVHPTGDIVASVGVDKSYVLYDLSTNSVITQIFTDAGEYSLTPFYTRLILRTELTTLYQLCCPSNSTPMATSSPPVGLITRSKSLMSRLAPLLRTSPCLAPSSLSSSPRMVPSSQQSLRNLPQSRSGTCAALRKPRCWTPAAWSTQSSGITVVNSC